MEIEFFLRYAHSTDIHNTFLVCGVVYDPDNDLNENYIHKFGLNDSYLSFCDFNDFSLQRASGLDDTAILTSSLEEFIHKSIWHPMFYDGIQILSRKTSLDNISMFIGIASISKESKMFQDNTVYRIINGTVNIKEYLGELTLHDTMENVLTKYLWFLNGFHFKILSPFMRETVEKIHVRHVAKVKEELGIVLDYHEIEMVELFKRDPHYNKLLFYDNPHFVEFLIDLYKRDILKKDKNAMSLDELNETFKR